MERRGTIPVDKKNEHPGLQRVFNWFLFRIVTLVTDAWIPRLWLVNHRATTLVLLDAKFDRILVAVGGTGLP